MEFERTEWQNGIDYGMVDGSDTVVLVKAGRGGDCRGAEDKYVKLAHSLRDRYGYSVICASNPMEIKDSYSSDRMLLEQYIKTAGFVQPQLYLMGNSDGARQGLLLATEWKQIQKLLLFGMPLMLNFHKTKEALSRLREREICFVYGTRDPSHPYLPYLKLQKLPNCRFLTVEGADHCFSGMTEQFLSLANTFFA